jgi:hypothetical protein
MYLMFMLCGAIILIAMFYAFLESAETRRNRSKWKQTASNRRASDPRSPSRRNYAPDLDRHLESMRRR